MTVAREAAIDIFLVDDLFHRVNRIERALKEMFRDLAPVFFHDGLHPELEPGQDHSAIA